MIIILCVSLQLPHLVLPQDSVNYQYCLILYKIFIGGPYPDELRYTNLDIIHDLVCYADFRDDLKPGMMCAGAFGRSPRDICSVCISIEILFSLVTGDK